MGFEAKFLRFLAIALLKERMEQYIVRGREHREFIATQVEGIKVETRHILVHLFGEHNIVF